MAHDEGLHAGHQVLRRRGDQGEAADHHTLHHEVQLPERRRRTLPFQHLEVVPMVWRRALGVALRDRPGDRLPDGSLPASIGGLPGQTIPLPGRADDALGILVHPRTFVPGPGVFTLGLDEPAAHLDGIELVPADATEQDLVRSRLGIEAPGPLILHDRHGKRPLARTHEESGGRPRGIQLDPLLFPRLRRKLDRAVAVHAPYRPISRGTCPRSPGSPPAPVGRTARRPE